MKKHLIYLAILSIGFVSCEPEFENPVDEDGFYSSGEANFSHFVAIGNSTSAGYADNALYISGQQNSFPNILAQQFSLLGGGEFTQPLMADNTGGLLLNGTQIAAPRMVLAVGANGNPGPAIMAGTPTTEVTNTLAGPFNNMGVPGAKVYHLGVEGYGNVSGVANGTANPYFARFASSSNASILGDALVQNPTFFTLWIGNNDVLGFATSGGTGTDQTGNFDAGTYGSNDITDPNVFAQAYSQIVDALVANETEGVLLNIPDVTTLPYFTTVPYAPLSPANPDFGPQIPTLNGLYAQLNQAFAFLGVPERSIQFSTTSASAVVVKDESLADISTALTQVLMAGGLDAATATLFGMQFGQARQATANDLLPLTSSSAIGEVNQDRLEELMAMGLPAAMAGQFAVNGVSYPMEDQWVLTPSEQQMIETARTAYNSTIQNLAITHGLAFVDASGLLEDLYNHGVAFDAGSINADFVTGGAFSLDGVHLTPRGNAVIANEIIKEINRTYGASVPKVNPGNYNTITLSNNIN
ncbi:MAG TPA: G-D-S-L family lipolytic protein [Salinimicrobium sp.]|nr:G-D-S-L family lipolytic protein [Salinimicrobium sp.]